MHYYIFILIYCKFYLCYSNRRSANQPIKEKEKKLAQEKKKLHEARREFVDPFLLVKKKNRPPSPKNH